MEKADIEKLSFVCILAVVGAVAITKPDLTGDAGFSEGIIRWLLFTLACGLVINDQEGRPFKIILTSSLAASSVLVLIITFKSYYLGDAIHLSGAEISVKQNPDVFAVIIAILLFASVVALIICSYARGTTLSLLNSLMSIDLEQAKKVEAILNKVVSIGAIAAVIIFSIV